MTIYLDNAATTAMRPAALETLVDAQRDNYGNPSGAHRLAREANRILDDSRETMADVLGAEPGQIVFTAGGTEADNLAIRGVIDTVGGVPVCSAIEHHAVLEPVEHHNGVVVGVDAAGRLDLDELGAVLDERGSEVSIVSVMAANNETGMIQPLSEAIALVRERAPQAVFHTDAVQALCWLDLAEAAAEADLISISAHKFGGPKGVGVLVVRNDSPRVPKLVPLLKGGGQERGLRGGTHNVAGVAAMAVAAAETVSERPTALPRVGALRDKLADGILASVDGAIETGDRSKKTANIAHFCFPGIASEALLFLLETHDVMASAASSCSSGAMEPSHVLNAMGYDRALAFGSLRLSLGYGSTEDEVDTALRAIGPAVARLRERG